MSRRLSALAVALTVVGVVASSALAGGGGVGVGGGDDGGDEGGAKGENIFPLPAKHSYGDGYGAGRGHQGQDVFAKCGKPIVAARAGRVEYRDYHGAAGNYIVINGKNTSRDYMYAHLRRRSPLRVGERVTTGDQLGKVGQTGNASGCHLHFELWRGDWNGRPDVTRKLRKWDRYS